MQNENFTKLFSFFSPKARHKTTRSGQWRKKTRCLVSYAPEKNIVCVPFENLYCIVIMNE